MYLDIVYMMMMMIYMISYYIVTCLQGPFFSVEKVYDEENIGVEGFSSISPYPSLMLGISFHSTVS